MSSVFRKTMKRFRDRDGSVPSRGFTLIELMVVICILGVLAAIAIPNLIRARDRGQFSACLDSIRGIKTALEMVAADKSNTTDPYEGITADLICAELMQKTPCVAADLNARVSPSCYDVGGGPWAFASSVDLSDPKTYKIAGMAKDSKKCVICITPNGVYPTAYSSCGSPACL